MDKRVEAEGSFFLFGMGDRRKIIWKKGRLTAWPDGEVLFQAEILREEIAAAEYAVRLETPEGTVVIAEDEEAVTLTAANGQKTALTASPVHLPSFEGHPYRDALRILHHEILVNIVNGKPLPNFLVYAKPWYRDGAMTAMVLERTGNIGLIAEWAASLNELYDRNNAGIEESDNLGQLLYLLAVTGNRDHPLIGKAIAEAQRRMKDGALTGLSDFEEHPVYQTKWLKLGLDALGLDSGWVKIPDVPDSYAGLFWMDGSRNAAVPGIYEGNYPYLSWAKAHTAGFSMDGARLRELRHPSYPLTLEAIASQADYGALEKDFPVLARERCAAPHTWHAAEVFLYLTDPELPVSAD